MIKTILSRAWDALASMYLALKLIALLMVEVLLCTFAQKYMGTLEAVNRFMRSWLVWWTPEGTSLTLPVFPGGALIGLLLGLNLIAATMKRLDFTKRLAALWLVHAGLVLLFLGEFLTGAFQEDSRMVIEQGGSSNYIESSHEVELAVIDTSDAASDDVHTIPGGKLSANALIDLAGTPLTIKVHRYVTSATLGNRESADPPSMATAGIGPMIAVHEGRPGKDSDTDSAAAFVEPFSGGKSYGIWLLSPSLGAPQQFMHNGRSYSLALRPVRDYLPYTITLKKFRHDLYPGTDIPVNFSSLVHISNPAHHEERDLLISMNQPLRYEGRAFYQASFGKGDTVSILQVVRNPGWLIPYISCVLVSLGLLVHFGRKLSGNRPATKEALS